jgi:2-phospho-L-lactate guanylyltransferase (CobY/MobA/RfbA family)
MNGGDYNRVVTTSPAMLSDPKMKAEVAAELARPEFQTAIAEAQRESPGPVEVEVVVSQYPQAGEQLKYNTTPK